MNLFLKIKKIIADRYSNELKDIKELFTPNYLSNYKSSYHLYIINLKSKNLAIKEKKIKFMFKKKIILQYHYIPLYKFKI